jgi:hypothetical protein
MRAAAALLAVLVATPALGFDTSKLGQRGSLSLEDIMPVVEQSPRLKAEVDKALAELKKKPDDIICHGMRFPGIWKELGGARVAPYQCEFGARNLEISTTVRVTSTQGKVFDKPSTEAMRQAEKVAETNPKWKWAKR